MSNYRQDLLEEVGEGIGYVKAMAEQKFELMRLQLIEKLAIVGSKLATTLLIYLFAWLIIGFGGVALSIYLGQVLHSMALGFLLVATFFALVMIGILLFKRSLIVDRVVNILIDVLKDDE